MLGRKTRSWRVGLIALAISLTGLLVPVAPASADSNTDVYTKPGYHNSGGRQWFTTCEKYSQTVRCRTSIYVPDHGVRPDGGIYNNDRWVFNNLTYLPYMTRAQWGSNPLANTGQWTDSAGRKWKTECDSVRSGGNGCRTYVLQPRSRYSEYGGLLPAGTEWVFNNIVMFKTG